MSDIQFINGTGNGIDTKIFIDGKEIEGVVSFSYDISVGNLGRVNLEMIVDSVDIKAQAEVVTNNKEEKKIVKKINRFEIMDI